MTYSEVRKRYEGTLCEVIRPTFRKHEKYGLTGAKGTIVTIACDTGEPCEVARMGVHIPGINNPGSKNGLFWFNPSDLKIFDKEYNMSIKIDENSKVCELINPSTGESTYGRYYGTLKEGDYVVADYHYSNGALSVRIVAAMLEEFNGYANCDVLGVADISEYIERKKKAERLEELKRLMAERARVYDTERYWEHVAGSDPEMAKYYDEYSKLRG